MTTEDQISQLDDAIMQTRAEHRNAMLALRETKHAYGHFVPKGFLEFLGSRDIAAVQLGDFVEMKASILFTDIRNFTALSEDLSSEEVFRTLNAYLGQYESPIQKNHGVIDKYLGDGALAIFRSADDAVSAGSEMLDRLRSFNRDRARDGLPVAEIGIGINTGYSVLGVVGNAERLQTTVIGDAVNVASRIQDLTRLLGTNMLISETTHLNLDDLTRHAIRFVDRIPVKGRLRPVSVYEVFDFDPEELKRSKVIGLDLFEDGVASLHSGRYEEAHELFLKYQRIAPQDAVLEVYLERCIECGKQENLGVAARADEEFLWRPEFDTGHGVIDEQHHTLVEIYDSLRHAVRDGRPTKIEEVLRHLKFYSISHFAVEAELMQKSKYPLMQEHLQEHHHFVQRLEQLSQAIRGSGRRVGTIVFWINIFLFDWLAAHSSKIDRHLARFISRADSSHA